MPTTRSGLSFDPAAFYQVRLTFDPAELDGPSTPHIPAAEPSGYVSPMYDPNYVAPPPEFPTSPGYGDDGNGLVFDPALLFPSAVEADLRYRIASISEPPYEPKDDEPYPDPVDPELLSFATISQFDPDFKSKIEALARAYCADDSSLSSVDIDFDMTESDLSDGDELIIGNDLWTTEIEDIAIKKAKEYLETSLYRDRGPENSVDWHTLGNGYYEIHDEYIADWDAPVRFYLMYHHNGTFNWVPGGALRHFPEIVKTYQDRIAGYEED
jgi:hypothetical protein